MRREKAITRLKAAEPDIRARGVGGLYLFGSVARDQAGPRSDVDLFIDPVYERLGFAELFHLEEWLSDRLGRPVELSTRLRLHPLMRSDIENRAIKVFG